MQKAKWMLVNYRFHCARYEMMLMLSIRLCFSQDIALLWKIPVQGGAENTSPWIIKSLFFINVLSCDMAMAINQAAIQREAFVMIRKCFLIDCAFRQ